MGYKIIASDLDGTLINSSGGISERNLSAIERLYNMGVHFVPTSGRAFNEMPDNVKSHPLIRYYISSDGGAVYDKKEDKTYDLSMPKSVSNAVLDTFYKYPVNMMVHSDTSSYVDLDLHNDDDYVRCNLNNTWRRFVYEMDVPKPDFKNFVYSLDSIQSFCVFFENMSDLNECMDSFLKMPEILTAQSHEYNIEVFSSKAGKGNALYLLADILGVQHADTIAVGDSTNDMTMVKAAGLGLAMDNAVDPLKAAADAVICDNDSHAIEFILNNYF